MQASGSTYAQKVSLSVQQAELADVLAQIQEQTNLDFLYNSSQLKYVDKIDLHVKNADLKKVLDACLTPRGLFYVVQNKTVLIKRATDLTVTDLDAETQQQQITGVVRSNDGEPLVGASIRLVESNIAAASQLDGSFSIPVVQDEGQLLITALGYEEQLLPYEVGTPLNIVLQAKKSDLDEVVVVGYGVQKKANLTGAVAQINAEDIALRPDANISATLQGLMPGLNIQINNGDPSATPDINVRGFNSINGGGPLVLIDGIEGDITRVNPNDIESVTLLKDAGTAAIYGARGAFGVLLITTKTGKVGTTTVEYTNNFAWTTPTARTDYISDPYVYAKTVDAAIFGYNGSSYSQYNAMDWEAIQMVARGEIEPFHELQADGTNKFFYNTDWWDYLFRKYQASNFHNVSVSGGSDKLRGYLSGRVFERQSINNINKDAGMDRQNMKANLVFTPYKWLEVSNNVQFINEKDKDYGGFSNGFGGLWSTTTWYNLMPFYPNFVDGVPTDIGTGSGGQGGNAGLVSGKSWRESNTEEFTNTFRVVARPLEGLQINFDYSNRIENRNLALRLNQFSYLSGNRLNHQTVGINRLEEQRSKDKYNALNLFATYQKSFVDKHNFKLLLGFNQEEYDRDAIGVKGDDLLIDDLSNLALATLMNSMTGSATDWAVRGFFGRLNYDYDNKYLLEVNSRYDGSSRFPANSRWGFFPSVSLGWQLDREAFWNGINAYVPSMKLRASYGKLGNQTVGVNTFKELMNVERNNSWLNMGNMLTVAQMPAPLPSVVTWETTKSLNVGADIGLVNNKLFLNLDWYRKNVEGMYLPGEPLPDVFGASEPRENYAALRNEGYEIGVSYREKFNVAGSPLRLNVTANVSNFKGIITKYNNRSGLLSSYYEGQRLGEIWGYRIDGQFQSDEEALAYQESFDNPSTSLGQVYDDVLNIMQNSEWSLLRGGDIKYLDLNDDGKIDKGDNTLANHGDLERIGNAMPRFPFGLNLNATWKNIDLSVAVAGVARQDWYPTGELYWGTYQRPYLSFIRKDLIDNAWTPDNKDNTYPQIYRGYSSLQSRRSLYEINDYYLTNVGYLRMRNLTVGYTLPQELTRKAKIDRLRIFFSGENMFTWSFGKLTKYIDPEQAGSAINYSSPATANDRGDQRVYPMGKTYSFGVMLGL
ncbi:SusC/RagA family TonB-linked outer membrane protein [Sphingobacterium sp. Ka21]|uniref:SusC/RagA family TonB-linked outer membrane protein n=1 Tax=Sphingobacterium pedocola TaxID=2082722 RepID=A0ABR9T9A6_9SPHI|nr:SusC/RagA family TonB-linked outer membrane protein [Sphingobacterium pedocola]